MSVSNLIDNYHLIFKALMSAIRNNDKQAIISGDEALTLHLQQILTVEPTDGSDKLELLDFFLKTLKPAFERSSVDEQICDRLQRICEKTLGSDQAMA